MPAKKTSSRRKGVYTISRATTKCAQKLGARGGRKTAAKKRATKRRKSR